MTRLPCSQSLKVAIITTDNRDATRQYDKEQPYFGTAVQSLLDGLAELPDLELNILCNVKNPVHSPELIAHNIRYHSILVPRTGWLITGYQGCIRAVRAKLRELQPAIVHGQGTERDCAISTVFSGFPNIITVHGNMRSIARGNRARPFSRLWLAARLEGLVLPRTRGVICISRYTQNAVRDLAQQTWLVPNAVDASFFQINASPDFTAPPIGLCVGTICPLKGQNALIRALDPLAKQKQFKLVFAGELADEVYAQEFRELIHQRPWCEQVGFITRDQLKHRLKTATFLVLPTLEDNCPMVILEAMAAGVPVIASNVGGVPDLITHGETGLLCNPQFPESFCQNVEHLLTHREVTEKLAQTAKAEAMRRFHPKAVARQHVDIYRKLLA